jgi:hypothetical protein
MSKYTSSLSEDNYTMKQKRWFVLSESLLLYFKTKDDTKPAGLIPLEYFTITLDTSKAKPAIVLRRYYSGFPLLKPEFVLTLPEEGKGSFLDNNQVKIILNFAILLSIYINFTI